MGEAVKAQMQIHSATMQAGDVWVSNHPAFGGSHLPDITVITPVMRQGRVIFFVANRGHHADVGGITPGSMPPFSKTLQDEGVVIRSFKLVAGGMFQESGIVELLQAKGRNNLIGTRVLADNISDLKAQVAANQKGIELLEELIEQNSLAVVHAYMNHLQDVAAQSVQSMLSDLSLARNLQAVDTLTAQDRVDDGAIIQLRLMLDRIAGKAVFDFSGTAGQLPNNMNTPKAVTQSAVIYCLRCLVQSEIPLNQGCLRSVKIILPEGSILSPSEDAAVVAGNVLTSQRITDVVFKAFKACAASQGCMNNLTFGNDDGIAYYETIGGGAGAGPGWHGQSGVHTHMTNTRITDPEILEKRYPVLLREFSIREDSGGRGRFMGGDGLIREIEFLEPLHVAILSERRVMAPYGLEGGEAGAVGKNLLIKRAGETTDLGGKNQFEAEPGDRIRILTPGGGGYGHSSR
jgi:5-oxoprolinase (ATP-hydrolysing)